MLTPSCSLQRHLGCHKCSKIRLSHKNQTPIQHLWWEMMMASQSSLIQLHQTLLCLMELSWCNKCLTSLLTNLTYQPPHQPHLPATSPTTLPTSSHTCLTTHHTNLH